VIYLFTVACSERSSTSWWARLFDSDRSYCFDRLCSLLEPEPTQAAHFEWLESLARDADFDVAQRHAVLRGFPEYFERLWERGRVGPFHIGNSDHAVQRLLPGLWLLWPDMRFLSSYRNGIGAVEAETAAAGEDDGTFEHACSEWAESVTRLRSHQAWLEERGADVRETRLERIVERPPELRDIWTALPGEWKRYEGAKRPLVLDLAAALEPASAAWERWPASRRQTFEELCGGAQRLLGYDAGGRAPSRRRLWAR
jgi:hypothetical protein